MRTGEKTGSEGEDSRGTEREREERRREKCTVPLNKYHCHAAIK